MADDNDVDAYLEEAYKESTMSRTAKGSDQDHGSDYDRRREYTRGGSRRSRSPVERKDRDEPGGGGDQMAGKSNEGDDSSKDRDRRQRGDRDRDRDGSSRRSGDERSDRREDRSGDGEGDRRRRERRSSGDRHEHREKERESSDRRDRDSRRSRRTGDDDHEERRSSRATDDGQSSSSRREGRDGGWGGQRFGREYPSSRSREDHGGEWDWSGSSRRPYGGSSYGSSYGGSQRYGGDFSGGGRSSWRSRGNWYSGPSAPWGGGGGAGRRSPPAGGTRLPGPERRDVMPFTPRASPPKGSKRIEEMTAEERDARTIFVMQLSGRIRPRDLEDFFSSVGKVRDVRIITDSRTKRSKGIAYIEFYEMESLPLAIGLNGEKLLGAPLMIQPTQAEKNRSASAALANSFSHAHSTGPMKLYVGALHFNITEEMLRDIFEPFGKVDNIQLIVEPDTGRSRGYGFITFRNPDDAKRAMEQLNGFEIAGRPMKVSHVTNEQGGAMGPRTRDMDELDRPGVDLGSTGRLQLMAKLAESSGMELPQMAQQMLQNQQQQGSKGLGVGSGGGGGGGSSAANGTPPIATQCFMLSNMFDPEKETNPNWELEVRDDVIEECNKHGGITHIFVDKGSPQGNVYVKCPTIATAVDAVNSLHGRWFSGKIITANYVPVQNYHQLFPGALSSATFLMPSTPQSLPPPPSLPSF